jgi:cysteine/O-acetylserine efflux protein
MENSVIPGALFVMLMTFTPGPNTITCASMGLAVGYRKTLPFILGIHVGFSLVMLSSALLCALAAVVIHRFGPVISLVGGTYILLLAWRCLRSAAPQTLVDDSPRPRQGFVSGLGLQMVNPKGLMCGVTLFSSFWMEFGHLSMLLASWGSGLAALGSTSLWALMGGLLGRLFRSSRSRMWLQGVFAFSLAALGGGLLVDALAWSNG